MALSDYLLYRLAKNYPSPTAELDRDLKAQAGTEAYDMAYAQHQFSHRVRTGFLCDVTGLDVLEIGSGHGGISCYVALAGARSVVGIDLNTKHLEIARRFALQVAERFGPDCKLPVQFLEMNGEHLTFSDEIFDLVLADNAFEHFLDPESVMRESYRVLRPGGGLLVPVFSSILSKNGLHLKRGIKLPWANLLFSERTIVRAMHRLAKVDRRLLEWYPGLRNNPQRVRDLRPYKDLNDITYRKFKAMAAKTGFRLEMFSAFGTRIGRVLKKIPGLRNTILMDVFSSGAAALLRKPKV